LPGSPLGMVGFDRTGERAAVNEAHRVERLIDALAGNQFIHRHNAGMLELSRQTRFADESRGDLANAGLVREQLLESHLAGKLAVSRSPHSADSAPGVQALEGIALAAGARAVRY